MTHTILSSPTKEVVIGFDKPFVMIGERINPTGRKLLAEEMKNGDFSRVEADAIAQVEAGAHMLDVNAGIPLADEPALLARAVELVQSVTDVPLSIDSSIIDALERGLSVYKGKALVNSVTGEDESLERVLPLVKKYGAAVVAISNDETGISMDPDVRFAVAKKIVERAADHGIGQDRTLEYPRDLRVAAAQQVHDHHRLAAHLDVEYLALPQACGVGGDEPLQVLHTWCLRSTIASLSSSETAAAMEAAVRGTCATGIIADPTRARPSIQQTRCRPVPPAVSEFRT